MRSLTLNDLTKSVIEDKHHESITDLSADVLAPIRNLLYHVHLPKLESEGLVTYDRARQIAEPTEQFEGL